MSTTTEVRRYVRPRLYAAQEAALFCPERWAIVAASTKSGKSVGCLVWLHEQAALHGAPGRNFWWVAPIYPQAKIMFRRLKRFLPQGTYTTNETELTITLANGAVIWFKGAERPDSLYGEDVYAAVIDEASRVKEPSWHAVRSTLTATGGPCRIIGNVKGKKNWFWRLGEMARQGAPDYRFSKLTAYDAVAGGVFPASEIEDARRALPELVFNELYLAEPGDDGSNPFGLDAIADCTGPVEDGEPEVFGWDLAKRRDYTVGIGLRAGRTVRFERFQQPWAGAVHRIRAVTGRTPALVDATGVGDPIVEELQRGGGNFEGFVFTSTSRQALLEGLALKISQRALRYPQQVAEELEAFEYVYTPTGVKYRAPEGLHDDCVMALALAVSKMGEGKARVRWI